MTFETIKNLVANNGGSYVYTTIAAIPGNWNGLVVSSIQSNNKFVSGTAKSVDFVAKVVFSKIFAVLVLASAALSFTAFAILNIITLCTSFKKEGLKATWNKEPCLKTLGQVVGAVACFAAVALAVTK